MIHASQGPHAGRGTRQREVEVTLAQHGLLRGPRRLEQTPGEPGFARRLAAALERLGPGFTAFGRYLASRPDLLPVSECVELAALPERIEPLPGDAVLALAALELGRPPQDVFASFEEEACASRLLVQEHRAVLKTGEPVVVRFLHPDGEERIEADLPWLTALAPAFAEAGRPRFPLAAVVADFRAWLSRAANLASEAEALELLASEADGFSPLRAPSVRREISTSRFLVFADPGGAPVDRAVGAGADAGTLARRLCLVWLRQACFGRIFPSEPAGGNLTILPGERVAFTGGVFARPPSAIQTNLWRYLVAAAERNPDDACTFLLREMTLEGASPAVAAAEEQLRLRLRQAVPFRDGGWSTGGDSLAEHLFLHWRFAGELGYQPRLHLVAFFRGLFAVCEAAWRLAPGRDSLLQGIEETRLLASVEQFGEMTAAGRMEQNLERYAALFSQLPQRLDEALTLAAAGGLRPRPPAGPAQPERERRHSRLFAAGLIGLGSVALLARGLAGTPWAERLGAVLVLSFGALLLWLAGRR